MRDFQQKSTQASNITPFFSKSAIICTIIYHEKNGSTKKGYTSTTISIYYYYYLLGSLSLPYLPDKSINFQRNGRVIDVIRLKSSLLPSPAAAAVLKGRRVFLQWLNYGGPRKLVSTSISIKGNWGDEHWAANRVLVLYYSIRA